MDRFGLLRLSRTISARYAERAIIGAAGIRARAGATFRKSQTDHNQTLVQGAPGANDLLIEWLNS